MGNFYFAVKTAMPLRTTTDVSQTGYWLVNYPLAGKRIYYNYGIHYAFFGLLKDCWEGCMHTRGLELGTPSAALVEDADPSSFEPDDIEYAHDAKHVYRYASIIPNVDPKTFSIIGDGWYYEDLNAVYFVDGDVVVGAKPGSTFSVVSMANDPIRQRKCIGDGQNIFCDGKLIPTNTN